MKRILKKIRRSKDGSALVSNFSYLVVLQIAGYAFPFITLPYLARVIGVEGFGKIAFAAAVILWFQMITDWGFNYTATRDVAQNRDNKRKVSEIFSNVFWARILLMLVSLAVLLLLIAFVPYFKEHGRLLLVTFLLVPGHVLLPDWFFQALERMKYIAIFTLVTRAFFTVLIFLFVKDEGDYILQPLFLSLGYWVCGLFSMYLILVRWGVKISRPDVCVVLDTIKRSTDVFVNNITTNLFYGFSVVLVGFSGGAVSNGLLDAGRKFMTLFERLMNIVSRVFYPFLARKPEKHNLYAKLNLALAVLIFLVLFFSAPALIKIFFTPEFYSAIVVLKISSLSIIFLTMKNVYGVNYLIVRGHERIARNIVVATSVIGFILSFPMVYFFDYIGAAVLVVIVHLLQGGGMMYKTYNIKKEAV